MLNKTKLKNKLPPNLLRNYHRINSFIHLIRNWLRRVSRLLTYRGNNVECPFCNKTFSRFRPTGVLERPFWKSQEGKELLKDERINVANARCPWCGSGERHRAMYFFLKDKLGIENQEDITLLDIAPDGFITKQFFSNKQNYFSLDIETTRNPKIVMDITKFGFRDSSFDAIICYHVLEHIVDDGAAIRELYNSLKPGGWAIIQVPIWSVGKTLEDSSVLPEQQIYMYGHKDHVRRCGFDYIDRLIAVGFQVRKDNYIGEMKISQIARFGLFKTEEIWICKK